MKSQKYCRNFINVNPELIFYIKGIFGTSAGGRLAATLGTQSEDVSSIKDSLDKFTFHPNFLILISPVIDLGKYAHAGSWENLRIGQFPRILARGT